MEKQNEIFAEDVFYQTDVADMDEPKSMGRTFDTSKKI